MEQKIKGIPLNNLKLDLYNPRLPKSKQGIDENTVIEFLLLEGETKVMLYVDKK